MPDMAEYRRPNASSDNKAPDMEGGTLESHNPVAAERALYESQLDSLDSGWGNLEELEEMPLDSDDEW